MSVAYVSEFLVRDGQRERFLQLMTTVLDTKTAETTYRAAILYEGPTDPRRFLLHEVWADHDDVVTVRVHHSYRRDLHEALPHILEGQRRIEIWCPVERSRFGSLGFPATAVVINVLLVVIALGLGWLRTPADFGTLGRRVNPQAKQSKA